MTAHAFIEFLKYKWIAKNRHGVHSPFVYAFVEDVLEDRNHLLGVPHGIAINSFKDTRYNRLLSRIITYYNYKKIQSIPVTSNEPSPGQCDVILITENEPMEWPDLLDQYTSLIGNNSVVIVSGIHKTTGHTTGWETLCGRPKVKLCIDLYGVGLLFFKEEIRERQRFVLKY